MRFYVFPIVIGEPCLDIEIAEQSVEIMDCIDFEEQYDEVEILEGYAETANEGT